jgi:GNAT superfamily N-acetyltransferase
MQWRLLVPADRDELIAVYRDAVLSQTAGLYRPEQVQAWAHHAGRDPQALRCLERGYGIASLAGAAIEAFGILDPPAGEHCRLALLYCRGRSCRQGRATALLERLEAEAGRQGCRLLHTEASQLSRPLLERRHWQVEREERLIFAGQPFLRWRMIKPLV